MATPKSKIARLIISKEPKITAKELAEKAGMNEDYASVFLAQERRKARGYPKFKKKSKVVETQEGLNGAAGELKRLHGIIEDQQKKILSLQAEVDNLHYQATGYDSVIDFLWTRLQER